MNLLYIFERKNVRLFTEWNWSALIADCKKNGQLSLEHCSVRLGRKRKANCLFARTPMFTFPELPELHMDCWNELPWGFRCSMTCKRASRRSAPYSGPGCVLPSAYDRTASFYMVLCVGCCPREEPGSVESSDGQGSPACSGGCPWWMRAAGSARVWSERAGRSCSVTGLLASNLQAWHDPGRSPATEQELVF